ncbi:hypothetical protein ACHAXT_004145, partial [Thalassiosira profunda]
PANTATMDNPPPPSDAPPPKEDGPAPPAPPSDAVPPAAAPAIAPEAPDMPTEAPIPSAPAEAPSTNAEEAPAPMEAEPAPAGAPPPVPEAAPPAESSVEPPAAEAPAPMEAEAPAPDAAANKNGADAVPTPMEVEPSAAAPSEPAPEAPPADAPQPPSEPSAGTGPVAGASVDAQPKSDEAPSASTGDAAPAKKPPSAKKKPLLPTKANKDAAGKKEEEAETPTAESEKKQGEVEKSEEPKETEPGKGDAPTGEAKSEEPAAKPDEDAKPAAKPDAGDKMDEEKMPPPAAKPAAAEGGPTFGGDASPFRKPAAGPPGKEAPPPLQEPGPGATDNPTGPDTGMDQIPGPSLEDMDKHTVVTTPGGPPPPPGTAPGLGRELKVEDALLYLDQVKMEFGDRPRIYNEFLEIMKNFKAQEVDTIGVINRVRRLFHGYNNLILGFNTFLPEGYKIEMRDLGPVFVGPGLAAGASASGPGGGPGGMPGRGGAGRGMPGRGPGGGRGMGPPGAGRGMPGRGMPPPGRGGRGMPGRGGPPQLGGRGGGPAGATAGRGLGPGRKPTPAQAQMLRAQEANQPGPPPGAAAQASAAAGLQATRTVEFDHAIMYVTNIKKRFANQPQIYHTFLEILHTYQKEQRGIKEVLEQVSSLFADHPDLLREFTFFLPDAVQEQAKERLSRAAAEAEAKQRAAAEAHAAQQRPQQKKGAPTGWRTAGGTPKGKATQGTQPVPRGAQKFIDMTRPDQVGIDSPSRAGGPGGPAAEFTYNAGVERQFFDTVKAALTSFSRDGQAYAEFVKTLDMYAQELLSRNEMLGYVERLLGKRKDLFEEFRRIVDAVGSPDAPAHDDAWHSVPLSEIDFSRCRRCSPSYRALPRDYPAPPCSDRSAMEEKVLNDVWVSLPLGSEENNTFRHMRKNQYEETLFRCEDMRFEIDMCIDSNAATLQRLTQIYEELQFLSAGELSLTKASGGIVRKAACPDGAGLGGKIYQYTLDGRVLGVIHKHAIRRIYGEDGPEMLALCHKNPAVALPIVVNRLRQKDEEFRAARDVLNRKWKDLGEHNYYRSLDHRSITWRTIDKRATSTRTIIAEIKDRAAHNGMEGEAAANARMDKMKEEHGTFYEVTMADAVPRAMDLTGLPRPTRTLFTPHTSFVYDNAASAQEDAYRIISFALERGSIGPGDKERCFRLWQEFVASWFGLAPEWMHRPATQFQASPQAVSDDDDATPTENGDESGNDDDNESSTDDNNVEVPDGKFIKEEILKPDTHSADAAAAGYFSTAGHIPFPPETLVSTSSGDGKVVQYIPDDGVYEVSYASAPTARLRPDQVYFSVDPVEPSLLTEQLRANDDEVLERSDDRLIMGTQCMYLFFRLYEVLVRRLNVAKRLAVDVSKDSALGRHIEKLTHEGDPDEGAKRYEAFLGLVYSLIEAGTGASEPSEGGKYEDRVRHLLGNNSYELTTMDKLINHVVKHLQHVANDDISQSMVEIYRRHELAGSFKPSAFREEAALMSEGENIFAFQVCSVPETAKRICHCEFLGCIAEDVEDEEEEEDTAEDNKRGIEDVADNDEEQAEKRPRKAS